MSNRAESNPRHFISIADWSRPALEGLLNRAVELKALRRKGEVLDPLRGKSVVLYFEKPSLRTFVTFQIGITELGGNPVDLPRGQVQIGQREPIQDVGRNLSRWCHCIVARTFSHELVQQLAEFASVPVINALTDLLHPCQAMADAQTILEHGDLRRDRLVYVGDGNNMAHSLIHLAGRLGMKLTVCTPEGFAPDPKVVATGRAMAAEEGGEIRLEQDPRKAVEDAGFIYTDVWASMGQEDEAEARKKVFAPYQVDEALLASAPSSARILHCLPAHRGEEITEGVFESPNSIVFDQAENRLHAQKAVLESLLTRD